MSDPHANQNFNRLTPSNWAEPDPTSTMFGRFDPLRGPVPMDGDDWAVVFLGVELGEHVPSDIVDLFDVAKGVLCYGWFFYPLFQLGEDQLHRVAEAAAKARLRQLQPDRRVPSLEKTLKRLVDAGEIAPDDVERWDAARHLRNRGSHHDAYSAMPPGAVFSILKATADDIDNLFASLASRGERDESAGLST